MTPNNETPAGIGHNSAAPGGIAADRLKSYVERIERLKEEQAALAEDVRDIFVEIKAAGFEGKAVREMLRLRKLDAADRDEQEALRDLYGRALGIWG
jgi:uncharacterized protein (UPF0335 family)